MDTNFFFRSAARSVAVPWFRFLRSRFTIYRSEEIFVTVYGRPNLYLGALKHP